MAATERYLEVHQYRTKPPTDYENALGDALETAFAAGVRALPDLVHQLNELGIGTADGQDWTERSFRSEMKRLAGA